MTTRNTVFIWDCVAGMVSHFSSIICWIFSSRTFYDPSEQTVYAEWSPSESIWAFLSLLLFAGALSSQFLTDDVNFIFSAGRTLELNSAPSLWIAGELSHCLWKQRTNGQARRKSRTWGNNSPQLEAPRRGFSILSVDPFAPLTAKGSELVQLSRVASYQLKLHWISFL